MRNTLKIILLITFLGLGTGCESHDGHQHEKNGQIHSEKSPDAHSEHDDHEGHTEDQVGVFTLTAAQEKELGVKVEEVASGSRTGTGIRPGRVAEDPDRKAVISSQVSGTLLKVNAKVGDRVSAGETLATLISPEVTQLQTEYHEAEVEADLAQKELTNKQQLVEVKDEIQRPVETATLELSKANSDKEAALANLHRAVLKNERLEKLLAEGIASKQQVEESRAERRILEAELKAAESTVKIAQSHLKRESRVSKRGLKVKAETFPAEASLARALEKMRHARERLEQLGARPSEHTGVVDVASPIQGVVVERATSRGETVSPGESIAVVMDLSTVWVWVDLRRTDLEQVGEGDTVEVSLENQPQIRARGVVDYISPRIDKESQALKTRIILTSPPAQFRIGSFVAATVSSTRESSAPSLPESAVQMLEGQTSVYIFDGKSYHRRAVTLGAGSVDGAVTIVSGLQTGEKVVVQGAQQLKAIDLSDTIGGHSH